MSISNIMEAEIRRLKVENKTLKERINDLEFMLDKLQEYVDNSMDSEEPVMDLTELIREARA